MNILIENFVVVFLEARQYYDVTMKAGLSQREIVYFRKKDLTVNCCRIKYRSLVFERKTAFMLTEQNVFTLKHFIQL
jgi:hypothetical protein